MSRRRKPAWENTIPAWPLDKQPASAPTPMEPKVQPPKEQLQHPDHNGLLVWQDPVTGSLMPARFREKHAFEDPYDSVIFPKMTVTSSSQQSFKGLAQRVVCDADNSYAGVAIQMDASDGYVDYKGANLANAAETNDFIGRRKARFLVLGSTATWFTTNNGRRRVMQQLTGAALLTNQGADVGSPNLPPISSRETVVGYDAWKLYRYPDSAIEDKTPYLQVVHRDRSITSFIGFFAADASEARHIIGTGFSRDTSLTSAIDMSIVSRRDRATEVVIGDTVARTLLLPDILPMMSPVGLQLA